MVDLVSSNIGQSMSQKPPPPTLAPKCFLNTSPFPLILLPPATVVAEGNVFTGVCLSTWGVGNITCIMG